MPFAEGIHMHAIDRVKQVLKDPQTVTRVRKYYANDLNYSGFLFTQLPELDRFSITATDLFAASTLSIKFEAVAAKRLIVESSIASEISRLLRLVPEISIQDASDEDFEKMSEFYLYVRNQLSKPDTKNPNRWVAASKLVTRKRPNLFPVRDNLVINYLGIKNSRNHLDDWGIYRSIMQDEEIRDGIKSLALELQSSDIDESSIMREPELRLLDVALWSSAKAAGR